jgi:hypothetical protein
VKPIEIRVVPTVSPNGVTSIRLQPVPRSTQTDLLSMDLAGKSFGQTRAYVDFSLSFSTTTFGLYRFIGTNATSNATLYLDRITVEETAPLGYYLPA